MAWIEAAAALSPASFWVPEDLCPSAWTQHAPFGFWLAETLRPRSFVELGTHHGYSFFALCQAVERLGLGACCYAVDTWKGDEHAGFYDEAVFRSVTERSARYAAFATLIRSSFEEASAYFADASIDLLHIDGRHGYGDVKGDYETWAGKLSPAAVVLFHDINVRERGFGVWRFFDELSAIHPSFRFVHGHGLGVLAPGGEVPPGLRALFDARLEAADLIRATYAALGGAVAARQALSERERDAATLRSVLAEEQRAAEAALGKARSILGVQPSREPTAPEARQPPADPGTEASQGTAQRARSPAPKARLTAGERAVPRRP